MEKEYLDRKKAIKERRNKMKETEDELDKMSDDIKRSMSESYLNKMFDSGVDRVNDAIEGLPNWVAVAILELVKADILRLKE